MAKTPPPGVPAHAFFEDDGWAVGEKDLAGQKIGRWRYWRGDGSLEGEEQWDLTLQTMTYQRFHRQGGWSQSGRKDLVKDVYVGTMRWSKSDEPSVEDRFFPNVSAAARFEVDFNDKGHIVTQRLFDRHGVRITPTGKPFPARPASVPEEAILVKAETCWLQQARGMANDNRFGLYRLWDHNGTLLEQREHGEDGILQSLERYSNGTLRMRKAYAGADEWTQTFYRTKEGQLVPESSTSNRNRGQDHQKTFFDDHGEPLYSVRLENVGETHERRYENDVLVFEAIWCEANASPPKVTYWEGNRLCIGYVSHGDNTGRFTLYAPGGDPEAQFDIGDEASLSENCRWARFLPPFAHYERDREHGDVEHMRREFLCAVHDQNRPAMLARLEIPEHLRAISEIDWTSPSASPHVPLDKLLVLFLGQDGDLADRALDDIWDAIEEHDCVFSATYDVALVLSRLLASLPAEVQKRAFLTLAAIIDLPALRHKQPERYKALIQEVSTHHPLIEAFARAHDGFEVHGALRLLGVLQATTVLRERMADEQSRPAPRALAACVLTACCAYQMAQCQDIHRALTQAFDSMGDPGVRVVLAVLLSTMEMTSDAERAEIDALLLPYVARPDRHDELVEAWSAVDEFLGDKIGTRLLRAMSQAQRLRCIEALVDGMAQRDPLQQTQDLDIVLGTLFSDNDDADGDRETDEGGGHTELSPLQRKALLAAAQVIDQNPWFFDQGEIFHKYDLPWDGFALRELANT